MRRFGGSGFTRYRFTWLRFSADIFIVSALLDCSTSRVTVPRCLLVFILPTIQMLPLAWQLGINSQTVWQDYCCIAVQIASGGFLGSLVPSQEGRQLQSRFSVVVILSHAFQVIKKIFRCRVWNYVVKHTPRRAGGNISSSCRLRTRGLFCSLEISARTGEDRIRKPRVGDGPWI
jgi:hypothetical protein